MNKTLEKDFYDFHLKEFSARAPMFVIKISFYMPSRLRQIMWQTSAFQEDVTTGDFNFR